MPTNAADLVVSLGALLGQCPASIALEAYVQNKGSLGVPAGVVVSFFEGVAPGGKYLGEAKTAKLLLPGDSEKVGLVVAAPPAPASYYAVVDADQNGQGVVEECVEGNNTGAISAVSCAKLR
ncbi:MAG: hypothetical protein HY744_08975 [Deltaproteobacteria bacterium]|nr:hypothetical protein [Deltaproteobacteria bacterium]